MTSNELVRIALSGKATVKIERNVVVFLTETTRYEVRLETPREARGWFRLNGLEG